MAVKVKLSCFESWYRANGYIKRVYTSKCLLTTHLRARVRVAHFINWLLLFFKLSFR